MCKLVAEQVVPGNGDTPGDGRRRKADEYPSHEFHTVSLIASTSWLVDNDEVFLVSKDDVPVL